MISPPRLKRVKIIDDAEEVETPEEPERAEDAEARTSNPTVVLGVRRLQMQEILKAAIQKLDEFFQQPARAPTAELLGPHKKSGSYYLN